MLHATKACGASFDNLRRLVPIFNKMAGKQFCLIVVNDARLENTRFHYLCQDRGSRALVKNGAISQSSVLTSPYLFDLSQF